MEELRRFYREGLTARIEALEQARFRLRHDPAVARETIAEIAHRLKGTGATYGFPEITEAARAVEEAGQDELAPLLERFLAVLREVVAGAC